MTHAAFAMAPPTPRRLTRDTPPAPHGPTLRGPRHPARRLTLQTLSMLPSSPLELVSRSRKRVKLSRGWVVGSRFAESDNHFEAYVETVVLCVILDGRSSASGISYASDLQKGLVPRLSRLPFSSGGNMRLILLLSHTPWD